LVFFLLLLFCYVPLVFLLLLLSCYVPLVFLFNNNKKTNGT
jgi:hypothetical protein